MISFDDFISKWNGKGVDTDGYYGFQCMDLAHAYCQECIGKDFPGQPTAKDVWNINIDGYDKIANSPTAVPSKGDIVIWGTGIGTSGHISVFIAGDTNIFTSFDQNWPLGSYCHIQNHNYTGVLGWFHPKQLPATDTISIPKADFENLVTKSTECDAYRTLNYGSPVELDKLMKSYTAKLQLQENLTRQFESKAKELQAKLDAIVVYTPPQATTLTQGAVLAYLKSLKFYQRIILFAKV